MQFHVLTLFPEMLKPVFESSIIGRAVQSGAIGVTCTDIRDFTQDKHHRVDDTPYGGGHGMILQCQPVVDCIRKVKSGLEGKTKVVYLSPKGPLFNTKKVKEYAEYDNLILLCGHYEGIDERIIELEVDEELSIGNYVLTGGELPAAVVIDAVARRVDGVLPSSECYEKDSLEDGLLEYPQYTKPRVFEGKAVPDVLLNGDHAEIEKWRNEQAEKITMEKRPSLLFWKYWNDGEIH